MRWSEIDKLAEEEALKASRESRSFMAYSLVYMEALTRLVEACTESGEEIEMDIEEEARYKL